MFHLRKRSTFVLDKTMLDFDIRPTWWSECICVVFFFSSVRTKRQMWRILKTFCLFRVLSTFRLVFDPNESFDRFFFQFKFNIFNDFRWNLTYFSHRFDRQQMSPLVIGLFRSNELFDVTWQVRTKVRFCRKEKVKVKQLIRFRLTGNTFSFISGRLTCERICRWKNFYVANGSKKVNNNSMKFFFRNKFH